MTGFRQLHGHLETGSPMAGRSDKLQRVIKEVADRCLAFALLLLLSPLMLAIAIAIYYRMGRPILFSQPRPGKGGNIFTFYKFRTMVPDEWESAVDKPNYIGNAPPDSQRITPFGQVLR